MGRHHCRVGGEVVRPPSHRRASGNGEDLIAAKGWSGRLEDELCAVEGKVGLGVQFALLTAASKDTALQSRAVQGLFTALSKLGVVLGLGAHRLSLAFMAVQQIISKNVVSMEELRRRLGDLLPGVLNHTARALGLTTEEFVKQVEAGRALAKDVAPAMTRAFQEMAAIVPAHLAQAQIAISRLGTAWFDLKAAIARSGVLDVVAALAEGLAKAADFMARMVAPQRDLVGAERVAQWQERSVSLARQADIAPRQVASRLARGISEAVRSCLWTVDDAIDEFAIRRVQSLLMTETPATAAAIQTVQEWHQKNAKIRNHGTVVQLTLAEVQVTSF